MQPLISIIMPVLNREDTIEKAILSVLDQNYKQWELIIVDGGSSDKTVDIIRQYEKHIAYWHTQRDGSAAVATNVGIKKAKGEVIALLMADDWYEPGVLMQIAEVYEQHPETDMITCAGRLVAFDETSHSYQTLKRYDSASELELNFNNIFFGTSAICFRFIKKSLYERIGLYIPFDKHNRHILTNDKEFLMRAVQYGAKNIFINYLGYTYFAHQESNSFNSNNKSAMRHCAEHMEIAENYLEKSDLSKQQQSQLRYWYYDQATKLVLFNLLNKQIREAVITWWNAFKRNVVMWPAVFCYVTCKVIIKKCK